MSMITEQEQVHTWSAFRPGTIPCEACGIAIHESRAEGVEPLEVTVGMVRTEFDLDGAPRMVASTIEVPVGRCEVCQQIADTSVDLLRAFPDVRRMIGDVSIAAWRVELALFALDALGVTRPAVVDQLVGTSVALARTMEAMAAPGRMALWSTAARARRGQKALQQPPSGTRWAHVDGPTKRALNEAYVELHLARTEKPVDVLAPSEDGRPTGCMLCGVGSWEAMPSQAHRVWAEIDFDPEVIGGRTSPESIDGVICPRCDRCIDKAGGVGHTAMVLSVLDVLGIPDHIYVPLVFSVVGWAVLNAPPSAEPWGHVDIGEIRDALAEAGVHGVAAA